MDTPRSEAPLRPEIVARQIEAMILDGSLKAGQRLPSERTLCEKLRVSRSSLREALKALRARGVIETRRGSGTSIAIFQEFQPSTPLQNLLQNHPGTLSELLETRMLLEGEAAYLAARRATEEDLARLTEAYHRLVAEPEGADPETTEQLVHLDISFHRAIYGAAHNAVLLLALNGIRDLMMSFMHSAANRLYPAVLSRRQINTQHRRIWQAICRREPSAARRATREHIKAVSTSFRQAGEQ